jgi:hypothetical protein
MKERGQEEDEIVFIWWLQQRASMQQREEEKMWEGPKNGISWTNIVFAQPLIG